MLSVAAAVWVAFCPATAALHSSRASAPRVHWERVDAAVESSVLARYFGASHAPTAPNGHVEIFCIDGVPAAAVACAGESECGAPVVEACHLNKGLLLLFDAGDAMRRSLFARHPHISLRNATRRDEFLLF